MKTELPKFKIEKYTIMTSRRDFLSHYENRPNFTRKTESRWRVLKDKEVKADSLMSFRIAKEVCKRLEKLARRHEIRMTSEQLENLIIQYENNLRKLQIEHDRKVCELSAKLEKLKELGRC